MTAPNFSFQSSPLYLLFGFTLLLLVSCDSGSGPTLSGSYQAASLVRVDSDINDPGAAANVSNNDFDNAQVIPTLATVQGFVTKLPTERIAEEDQFASESDEVDIYRVTLQANQLLTLQVVDFAGSGIFLGDLDLFLHDLSFNILDASLSVEEFESITVPEDGEYYIAVYAYDGASKYILSLANTASSNISPVTSMDFRTGEAIVKFKKQATIAEKIANQSITHLSHRDQSRATLASFDVSTASASSHTSGSTNSSPPSDFEQQLMQRNPSSYEKYKTLQKIKQLNQDADIELAEPNHIYRALRVPNDTRYSQQWHYPAINLPDAWDITTGSRAANDVIVAVVDTGVFLAHPDLDEQLINGYDFISDVTNANDGDGIDDNADDPGDGENSNSWHGTHVAGTVAAETNNNDGVAGVAWHAKIMPLRVLGTRGGSGYDIIQAIRFAAQLSNDSNTLPTQKADIINLSLGGYGSSQASQDAYSEARAAGVIVVAAAGNENTDQLSYPASYEGVISVSATGSDNSRASYSNYGSLIDIAAPGGDGDTNNGVLSTLVNDDSNGSREPAYEFYQGTSMAAPHAAGVFALMRAVYPNLSPDELDHLIEAQAISTDLGDTGRDDFFGFGLIDALKAVEAATELENGGTLPPRSAWIVSTPYRFDLGADNSAVLTLSNQGDEDTEIVSFSDDADWLTLNATDVDVNGLGEYQLSIDRTGLSDALYSATITFNMATGSTLDVPVSILVAADSTGDSGKIYVLLRNEANMVVKQASVTEQGNGVFSYNFTDVANGTYSIIGGSDIDNDNFICQLAEACGGYPELTNLSGIQVMDNNISGLDFTVDIGSDLSANNLSQTVVKR